MLQSIHQFRIFTMKMHLEKGQTRTKFQNEQQPHGFISILSRNQYQKLS